MKYRLKEDWLHESTFFGQKMTKKLYEKGHIFEPDEKGNYHIMNFTGEIALLEEDQMKQFDLFEPFEETQDIEIIIEEIPDDDDILVRNWRIQLDVKTTRKKLKEVERIINEQVKPIL